MFAGSARRIKATTKGRPYANDPVVTFATWAGAGQTLLAVLGIVVAALVAFMPYARRPRLGIEEDTDRIQSRVELSGMGGLPHVRLLVANAKRRRAAHGTRVIVEGYRRQDDPYAALTTLGHPSLGWPSAPEASETAAVTVFAGGTRPITLGLLLFGYALMRRG